MAGISHLYDLYKKDPKFVESLLSKEIEVEEKLDGSKFSVEVDDEKFKFFKRGDASPITKIDRTLARYYEKAISHFESLALDKVREVPDGWRFGFEYFPNLMPVRIAYDRMPKNHLVLTEITIRDPKGRVLEIIHDKELIDKWANFLEVEGSPVIFKGKLSDEQRKRILNFLNTPHNELIKRFKHENFAAYFLNVLSPGTGKSFMQNSLTKDIEAIVFKFDGENPLKIMNPVYSSEKYVSKDDKPSDIYSLTLVIFQEFFQSFVFSKVSLKEHTFEERYIEFISKAFVNFCKSTYYKNNFSGEIDFEMPSFLTRAEADLNFKFVKDKEAIELLKKSSMNRELFKIMLASMRAHKKKPFGFFKKELIWHHNKLVDKIADYVNIGIKESFLAFREFREIFLMNENENEWEEYGIKLVEDGFQTVYTPVSATATSAPIDKENKTAYIEVLKELTMKKNPVGGKNVTIILSRTVPYHNGIVAALKNAKEITGQKSYLVMVGNPFSDMQAYKSMSEDFLNENKDQLEGLLICTYPTYNEVQNLLNSKKMIATHLCGEEHLYQDFSLQTQTAPNFIEGNDYFGTEIPMKSLQDDDIKAYKTVCPPVCHNYYYKLKHDLK